MCPHWQVSIRTYWPKWSESFVTVIGGRGGIIDGDTTAFDLWIAGGYLVQYRVMHNTVWLASFNKTTRKTKRLCSRKNRRIHYSV